MATFEMQQRSDVKHPGRFIAGMLLGGLAGAVTSLLLAPQSGKETRKLIQAKTIELRDKTSATVDSVSHQVSSKAGQIKTSVSGKVTDLTEQGKEMLAKQFDRLSVFAKNEKNLLQRKSSQSKS
jgi:gas vesicle protein